MISLSNIDVLEVIRAFSSNERAANLDVSFLVPTINSLEKSIMDATKEVRLHFKKVQIHHYDEQAQGPEHKVILPALIFSKGEVIESKCSLYRPNTKQGDPRIWFAGLKIYAEPTDLLALVQLNKGVAVINCSQSNLGHLLDLQNKSFWSEIKQPKVQLQPVAVELLGKLIDISSKGYIPTLRSGDTGVGYTLETLLGIAANSSKSPDYGGIELKSSRNRGGRANKITMFSKTPNWFMSRLKHSKEILSERGYYNEIKSRRQLYHTISSLGPNSLGLVLNLENELLHQNYVDAKLTQHDVLWEMDELCNSLSEKHKETFWISADTQGKGASEKFHYKNVNYTAEPDLLKMRLLIEAGAITVDYTISEKPNGSVRDKGYLFKIAKKNIELLFKPIGQFPLC